MWLQGKQFRTEFSLQSWASFKRQPLAYRSARTTRQDPAGPSLYFGFMLHPTHICFLAGIGFGYSSVCLSHTALQSSLHSPYQNSPWHPGFSHLSVLASCKDLVRPCADVGHAFLEETWERRWACHLSNSASLPPSSCHGVDSDHLQELSLAKLLPYICLSIRCHSSFLVLINPSLPASAPTGYFLCLSHEDACQ